MSMKIIKCNRCLSHIKISILVPKTSSNDVKFCPLCGNSNIEILTNEPDNYWQSLSDALELPAALVMKLYILWDTKEYTNFRDFVRSALGDETRT